MKTNRNRALISFAVGFTFAIGLAIAGMTQPQKIIAFLDPWSWDPSLIFVMAGAVAVHAITYPMIRRRPSPLLDHHWHVPTRKDLSARLIVGSALFGIGWGLGGYCPGPGLASLSGGSTSAIAFVGAMLAGMLLYKKSSHLLKLKE